MNEYLLDLYRYEHWANSQIADLVSQMPVEKVPERVRLLFSHILAAERIWYYRLTDQSLKIDVWAEVPVSEWKSRLQVNIALLSGLIEKMQPIDYERVVSYHNSQGKAFTSNVREILTHAIIHSGYHRGQIIVLLKPTAPHLPLTDYIHYAREVRATLS